MDNSNECPNCGRKANHLITDIDGKNYYKCSGGLTTFRIDGEAESKVGRIVPCDTIIHRGQKFTGTIAYVSDNKVKTLAVTDGKERR